jgi:hypothetical protein
LPFQALALTEVSWLEESCKVGAPLAFENGMSRGLLPLSLTILLAACSTKASPLPEMNALAFPVGDGTLSLFDTKTMAFTSLALPGHFRSVKPFAHAGVLWIVASDDQATDDVLLSHVGGKWSSYPIRLPSDAKPAGVNAQRAYAELAGLQWGDNTSPPHLWLRSQAGERFEIDPPEVAVQTPATPPPLPRVGLALPPDDVARSSVPQGTLRTLDFQVPNRQKRSVHVIPAGSSRSSPKSVRPLRWFSLQMGPSGRQ